MKRFLWSLSVIALLTAAMPPPRASTEEIIAPLSQSDTQLVINWIARQVADSRQDYCYRQSHGRGVGKPLSTCNANEEKNGLLCYPKCESGYAGAGPVCWEECPSGYTNTGAFCTRPAVTEHLTVDHPHCPEGFHNTGVSCYNPKKLKSESLSHAECSPGLHKKGELCYSDCQPGFTNTGVSCYRGPDTIAKKSRGRGAGSPMKCSAGEQEDAGLCYSSCQANFHGVGPVCWQNCPGGRTDCGAGCATGKLACASDTASMIISPVALAWNIATFGSTSEVSETYKGVVSALKTAKTAMSVANAGYQVAKTVDMWAQDVSANFDKLTTPAVKRELEARFRVPAQLTWIKRQYALNHLHLMLTRDLVETDLNELKAVSGFDPSGVTGVIAAFAKPICSSADPFPNVKIR